MSVCHAQKLGEKKEEERKARAKSRSAVMELFKGWQNAAIERVTLLLSEKHWRNEGQDAG